MHNDFTDCPQIYSAFDLFSKGALKRMKHADKTPHSF